MRITKKKLQQQIDALAKAFEALRENTQLKVKELTGILHTHDQSISQVCDLFKDHIDTISGKEAAEMLGWKGYMKSSWLTEKGIRFTQDDNGVLHISRTDMEKYINNQNKE